MTPLTEALASSEGQIGPWKVTNRVREPLFGLIRLDAAVGGTPIGAEAKVAVTFGGVRRVFPAAAVVVQGPDRQSCVRVHVVSHLVSNGPNHVSGEVRWPDGTRTPLAEGKFEVDNVGRLAELVREDLQSYGTPALIGGWIDSRMFPLRHGKAQAWFNVLDPPDVPLSLEPSRSAEAARLHLIRWGFAVLNYTIDLETIRRFRGEYEAAIAAGDLAYVRGTSQRIRLAHRLPHGRKIWLDPVVLSFLREWFRDEPCACQTLLYIHGSEQKAHQDTIHLTPYPAGFMCGVWVALQDVEADSGELFVLPGSHRTPRVTTADIRVNKVVGDNYSQFTALDSRIEEIIRREKFEALPYRPRAGQVLVWHENLIHGGALRTSPERQRHSIVSHYFARGSVAYYDSRGEAAALERVE